MEKDKENKRSVNFSKEEERLLISLVEKHKKIIETKKSDAATWKDKEKAWIKLEAEFNAACCTNGKRTARVLKEKYRNLKKKTKEKFSTTKTELIKTGGGKFIPPLITEIDEAIRDIVGEEQIAGLRNNYDNDATITIATEEILTDEHNYAMGVNYIDGINTEEEIEESSNSGSTPMQKNTTDDINTESTSNFTAHCDWTTYTGKNLKTPVSSKLQVTRGVKRLLTHNTSETMAKKKISGKKHITLNTKLIEEKLDFVRLQREKFLEEHNLKMELLKLKIEKLRNQQ